MMLFARRLLIDEKKKKNKGRWFPEVKSSVQYFYSNHARVGYGYKGSMMVL